MKSAAWCPRCNSSDPPIWHISNEKPTSHSFHVSSWTHTFRRLINTVQLLLDINLHQRPCSLQLITEATEGAHTHVIPRSFPRLILWRSNSTPSLLGTLSWPSSNPAHLPTPWDRSSPTASAHLRATSGRPTWYLPWKFWHWTNSHQVFRELYFFTHNCWIFPASQLSAWFFKQWKPVRFTYPHIPLARGDNARRRQDPMYWRYTTMSAHDWQMQSAKYLAT